MEASLIFLASYQFTWKAQIFKSKLASEGIEVFLRDNNIVDSNPLYSNAVGGVKLFVSKADYQKSLGIISEIPEFSLDNQNKLMKCPSCGAEQISIGTSIKDTKALLIFIFSLILRLFPFYYKYRYKCNKCNFEFN